MAFSEATKSKDVDLWQKWHKSRSSADLEALMRHMNPVLNREVSRWASIVPRFVLENEAKALALKAFGSFDPNRGVLLSTHVTNQLQKLSRTAYARQSTVSIPEHKRLTYNRYRKVIAQLEDEYGRPPEMHEIADQLALPVPKLQALISEVEKREYLESEEHAESGTHSETEIIELALHDLTPTQQTVFKHKTGWGGAPIKSNAQLMKELNLTQGQLSYELTKVKNKLTAAKTLMGRYHGQ